MRDKIGFGSGRRTKDKGPGTSEINPTVFMGEEEEERRGRRKKWDPPDNKKVGVQKAKEKASMSVK